MNNEAAGGHVLTGSEFESAALDWITYCNEYFSSDWEWIHSSNGGPIKSSGHLELKVLVPHVNHRSPRLYDSMLADMEQSIEMCQELETDHSTRVSPSLTEKCPCLLEYHIVYSSTYQVPTLYFRGFDLVNKEYFTWNDFQCLLPKDINDPNQRTFITTEEHPILEEPFFFLHPCQTSENIKTLNFSKFNKGDSTQRIEPIEYLLQWFAMVSQGTKARLSPEAYVAILDSIRNRIA